MKVLIILGSVRKVRNTPVIGGIVQEICAGEQPEAEFEIVDLKNWTLPMDAEEAIPMTGVYTEKSTQAWSEKVLLADAYVVVTPQYNWGYPAALKNAFDILYKEWVGKPVGIVTFGGHGGDKCSAQLHSILSGGFRMNTTATAPKIMTDRAFAMKHIVDREKLKADCRSEVGMMARELAQAFAAPSQV